MSSRSRPTSSWIPQAAPSDGIRTGLVVAPLGYLGAMWLLILLILALVLFGIWGAIKIAFWVLLIALLVALVAGFLGRGLFGSRGAI
jgi:hypothetical protein